MCLGNKLVCNFCASLSFVVDVPHGPTEVIHVGAGTKSNRLRESKARSIQESPQSSPGNATPPFFAARVLKLLVQGVKS